MIKHIAFLGGWRFLPRSPRIGLAAAFLLLAGCSKENPATSQTKGAGRSGGAVVPVLVAKAESRDVPDEVYAIGNVQAFSTVAIRAQITGQLLKVHFKEGDEVKAGDLLFSIDSRPQEGALNRARADLKRDEAQLTSARLDLDRVKRLFENSISSREDYDRAQAGFESLEATVMADASTVSNATLNLEYTSIRSPLDGRTGAVLSKQGNIIKAEDDRLVTIHQVHPIQVAFSVPQQDLVSVRAGAAKGRLAVTARAAESTNVLGRGELSFVDNAVDSTTGTVLLKATFPNEDNALWPGQIVQATLVVNTISNATVVPSQAVQSSQNGELAFVVKEDSSVERRNVEIGISRDGWLVIKKGVAPGETVVIDGQLRIGPGSKVKPQAPGSAPAGGESGAEPGEKKQ
jgi:multidrug efflux system membrane fusion protein